MTPKQKAWKQCSRYCRLRDAIAYCEKYGIDHIVQTEPILKIRPINSHRSVPAVERYGYLPVFEKENAFALLGEFDKVTNYRYTATEAGYYHATLNTEFNIGTDNKVIANYLYKNGSAVAQSTLDTAGTERHAIEVSKDIFLNGTTDYIEFYCYHQQGGAKDIIGVDAFRTYFSIHKLETSGLVAIDSVADAGYLGAASGDGVLRVDGSLTYTDGGDFITIGLGAVSAGKNTARVSGYMSGNQSINNVTLTKIEFDTE
ncbi:hypothetical protein LCGC14_1188230, partial [marine sediment metagenome]